MNENRTFENTMPHEQLPRCQPPAQADEADRLWEELQALWDEQNRRIDEILAASEHEAPMHHAPSRKRPGTPLRIRLLRSHIVLLGVFVAAAIYWGTLIPSLAYTVPAAIVCAAIEGAYLLTAFECLKRVRSLAACDPVRTTHGITPPCEVLRGPRYGLTATCIAAVTVLVVAACAPTGGDSCGMIYDQPSRAAVIEILDQSIASI